MCCFSAKHPALRSKSKDCLARNQNYVSVCLSADFWFSGLALLKNQLCLLVQSGHNHVIEFNIFSPWYSWKIVYLALSNNQSLNSWRKWSCKSNVLDYWNITLLIILLYSKDSVSVNIRSRLFIWIECRFGLSFLWWKWLRISGVQILLHKGVFLFSFFLLPGI